MERPKIETVEVTTPTGYVVTLKKKLTYGEKLAVDNEAYGDVEVGDDESFKMKVSQASESIVSRVFHHIASWDVTDNNEPVALSIDSIKNYMFEDDINFLTKEIANFKPNPKKEIGS